MQKQQAVVRRYESLDLWRGVACLFIVVFHSTFYAPLAAERDPAIGSLLMDVCDRLWIGVPMFFVISGYCIAAAADRQRARGSAADFFRRRFRRIFPPYWAALAIFVPSVWLIESHFPGPFSAHPHPILRPDSYGLWQWIGNLTLTEGWRSVFLPPPANTPYFFLGQAWTLGYEEQFYAIVGLLLLCCRRWLFVGTAIVAILSTVFAVVAHLLQWDYGELFPNDFLFLHFALGIAVYRAVAMPGRLTGSIAVGSIAFCLAVALHRPSFLAFAKSNWQQGLLAASVFAALVWTLARWDERVMAHPVSLVLKFAGDRCYSLYLVHWPICKLISHSLHHGGVIGVWPTLLITVPVCIVASLVAATGFHWAVERHFISSKPTNVSVPIPLAVPN